MSRPWKAMYQRWKELHPEAKQETRQRLARGCVNKLAHPNFLSALMAATDLNRDYKGRLCVYKCAICNKHHVGRRK